MGTEAGNWKGGGNRRDGIGNKEKGQERQHRKWKGIIRNRRVGTERELGGAWQSGMYHHLYGQRCPEERKGQSMERGLVPL